MGEKKIDILNYLVPKEIYYSKLFILLLHVFLVSFTYLQQVIMTIGVTYDLYCGHRFHKVIILFLIP